MNSKSAKRIQEMFRISEIITVNEQAITPIYKVRENVEKNSIKEDELKEYLAKFTPSNYQTNIPIILQKIYHPMKEDNKNDEILRLSPLR